MQYFIKLKVDVSEECNDCNRQFVKDTTNKFISKKEWEFVDILLLERISIVGISRVKGILEL